MINKVQITGVHSKVDDDLEAYVKTKIGVLDKFVPKKYKETAKADVKLKEGKGKSKDKFTCEVIVSLPHEKITVHEKSSSFPAAIDACEDKLKIQLKKYKEKHGGPGLHKRIAHKFKRFPQIGTK